MEGRITDNINNAKERAVYLVFVFQERVIDACVLNEESKVVLVRQNNSNDAKHLL